MAPHTTTIRVRFCELDPYSHVNHSVYVQYFEEGRVDALAAVGQSLDAMLADDVAMVVAQISTRFLSPGFLSDELVVESGFSNVRRASATWLQRICRGDTTLATQVARVGCTSGTGKPRPFPQALNEAVTPFEVAADWLGGEAPRGT